jgi:para-nitrobenzyl esterase
VRKKDAPELDARKSKEEDAMTTNRLILILLFVIGTACTANAAEDSAVMTEQGGVAGIVTPTLRKFLGIPYAAPPVGDLRWTPPQPHARWDMPLDATQFRNHCPQVASVFGVASVSEDCLFLNIFTPNDEENGRRGSPVMVWIHGGALTVGESDDYIPTKLVQQGHVIVVTINYRLGAFGFLAHPALSGESPDHISGNYGLMDQQFALKWVQRNIAAFGGDPRNVTIFGESGGGLSVFSHLASPLAAGLFHGAIVQSGAYELSLPTLADEESHGLAFAVSVGCKDQSAQCLRSKSVKKILANWGLFDSNPNVDGKLLRQSLDTAVATGQFNRVPVMQGTNHDEWRLFVALDELSGAPIPAAAYPSAIVDLVGPDAAPLVLAEYPLDNFASPSLALGAVGTDLIFACPARGADQVLSTQVPTFAYEFNDSNAPEVFLPPVSFPYGATHVSELLYLFQLSRPGELNAQQQILSDNMVRYWVQFARSGNPNGPGLPFWPRYESATDKFQSLVLPSPMPEFGFATDHKCDFWSALFSANSQGAARVLK